MLGVPAQVMNFLAELVHREVILESLEDRFGDVVDHAEFLELMPEDFLVVRGGGDVLGRGDVARRRIDRDFSLAIDGARTKGDRGDVTLARGAEAQDETQRPGGKSGLVGMGNDGRIEQGGRLERVLVGEVGADEKLAFLREPLVGGQQAADEFEADKEVVHQPLMACFELGQDLGQHLDHLRFGQGQHAREDAQGALVAGRVERTEEDARGVGFKDDSRPGDFHDGVLSFFQAGARLWTRSASASWSVGFLKTFKSCSSSSISLRAIR